MRKRSPTKKPTLSAWHREGKNWTYLKIKVPKECLPLLEELIAKVPEAFHSSYRFKGRLILDALQFLNRSSPGGLCLNGGQGWRPADPSDVDGWYQNPSLRLVK